MNKYEQTTLVKKACVINSALYMFAAYGYGKVTMKDIAKESNVSLASIYNYFGSKEEIIDSIIHEWITALETNIQLILDSSGSFPEKIDAVLEFCDNELGLQINHLVERSSDQRFTDLIKIHINKNKQMIYMKILHHGRITESIDKTINDDVYLKFIDAINKIELNSSDELKQIKKLLLHGILK